MHWMFKKKKPSYSFLKMACIIVTKFMPTVQVYSVYYNSRSEVYRTGRVDVLTQDPEIYTIAS